MRAEVVAESVTVIESVTETVSVAVPVTGFVLTKTESVTVTGAQEKTASISITGRMKHRHSAHMAGRERPGEG